MCRNENKKALFVVGMESDLEQLMKKMPKKMNLEDILIFQSYGSITTPFSDLMRDILFAVYEENVEEIYVEVSKIRNYKDSILKKVKENKELQGKIQAYDYLLKNCMPEFTGGNIREWLEGSQDFKDTVQLIRNHPLLPSHVKVTEFV